MLLPQLQGALDRMRSRKTDLASLTTFLNDASSALEESGVRPDIIASMREKVVQNVQIDNRASPRSNLLRIEQVVFKGLCTMFFANNPIFIPEKGQTCVVLFIGGDSAGPETNMASVKYTCYQKLMGYDASLVCAVGLRTQEYNNFRKSIREAGLNFFASFPELDRVGVARRGVKQYRDEKADIIVVVANHDIVRIADEIKADLVVVTVDASVGGERIFGEMVKYKENYPSCAALITGLHTQSNAAAVIAAVAAAQVPLLFIESGNQLQMFDSANFVTKLLGMTNRIIEVDIQDFQDVFIEVNASEAEQLAVVYSLKESFKQVERQQFAECRSLSIQICNSEKEYTNICQQLGEKRAEESKLKAQSLQERLEFSKLSVKCVKETKNARLQELGTLQSRFRNLCHELEQRIENEEHLKFLLEDSPLTLEEILKVNNLALSNALLRLLQNRVTDLESLKSEKLAEVTRMMEQYANLLQKQGYLKHCLEFKLDFTIEDVQSGAVTWKHALTVVKKMIDEAEMTELLRKLLSSQARGFIECTKASEATNEKIDAIRAMSKKIEEWQTRYKWVLYDDEDDPGDGRLSYDEKLRDLNDLVKVKLADSSRQLVLREGTIEEALDKEPEPNDANMSPATSDVSMSSANSSGDSSLAGEEVDGDGDKDVQGEEVDGDGDENVQGEEVDGNAGQGEEVDEDEGEEVDEDEGEEDADGEEDVQGEEDAEIDVDEDYLEVSSESDDSTDPDYSPSDDDMLD